SQQCHPRQWDEAIALTGRLFSELASSGVELRMVNLGGGFPAHYRGHVPPIEAYAEAIMKAMEYHFGGRLPEMVVEPGRYPTGDSVDILYEQADYRLPLDLAIGDTVDILAAGAYTTCYSTVGFNGFGPLACYCI